jgi:hypothetical protein
MLKSSPTGYEPFEVRVEGMVHVAGLENVEAGHPSLWAARGSNPARRIKRTLAISAVLTCEDAFP